MSEQLKALKLLSAPVGRDKDGTICDGTLRLLTKYTPTVVGVTPTAAPAETKHPRCLKQANLSSKGGTVEVNGVEKLFNQRCSITFRRRFNN